MKKPNLVFSFLFLLTLLFSGCFEIREEVNMKADGSGEVRMVFDLRRSKGKLKQYMKLEKVENYRVPKKAEIEALFVEIKKGLRAIDGISYADSKSDWSNFIFEISARFDNVEALNAGVKLLSKQLRKLEVPTITEADFEYKGNRFKRLFDYPPKPEKYNQLPSLQRFMLESSHMTCIYRFEKMIANFTHKKAMVSPSGKAIMLKLPFSDLITGKGTLENDISF